MARSLATALLALFCSCAGDPTAGVLFACDPTASGPAGTCMPGCRCEAAPPDRPYAGVCVCGATPFDFGPSAADADAADDAVAGDDADDGTEPDAGDDADAWTGDSFQTWDGADGEETACVPDCQTRACGSDGCDGICGTCGPGFACTDGVCISECWDKGCPPGFVMGDTCRCRVPSTGSRRCNNGSGLGACSLITEGQDFFGQDGHFDGSFRTYIPEGDGTIRDADTGLVWAATTGGDGTWSSSMSACTENVAELPGASWHLPSAHELIALVDHGKTCPTWDALFGMNCGSGPLLWSSTVRPNDVALVGDFEQASLTSATTGAWLKYRCVRGGGTSSVPVSADRFAVRTSGVVDRLTGLEWQLTPAAVVGDWKTALATCLGRGEGWRLPTVNELASIAIFQSTGCVAWPAVFGTDCGAAKVFWSSTPQAWTTEGVACMDFGSYTVVGVSLFETSPATRCVRSADAEVRGPEAGR